MPPSGTYSVSFWFFRIARLDYLLSFFRFFFWKNDLRSEAEKATNREQEAKKANVTKCKTFKTGRL